MSQQEKGITIQTKPQPFQLTKLALAVRRALNLHPHYGAVEV